MVTKTKVTWEQLSARAGRNDMPSILADAYLENKLDNVELAKAISGTWVLAEWPARALTLESWLMLFKKVLDDDQYLTDEGLILSMEQMRIPETLTLWRGAMPEFKEGLSWTADRDQAEWFAHRFNFDPELDGHVYEITIPNHLLLAQFNGRGEFEYVVDLEGLFEDDIQEVS